MNSAELEKQIQRTNEAEMKLQDLIIDNRELKEKLLIVTKKLLEKEPALQGWVEKHFTITHAEKYWGDIYTPAKQKTNKELERLEDEERTVVAYEDITDAEINEFANFDI